MGADKKAPPSEASSKALAGYKPVDLRHAPILKSWRDHSHKDERVMLWRSFEQAAAKHGLPAPHPAKFIGIVLGCTMRAARLNDHREHVLKQFEKTKDEIVKIVEDADYPWDLWRDLQRFEDVLWQLDRSDYDMNGPLAGGRNDSNSSRDRKLFAQRMFRCLEGSCGEYLVKEVTVMLNIIYPIGEVTEERVVRKWLADIVGGRLPDDWQPTPIDLAVAIELIGEQRAQGELEKFKDHWKQQPGSKGVKLDWDATWRIRIRRAAEDSGPTVSSNPVV